MIGITQVKVDILEFLKFNLSGEYVSCKPISMGHINNTFKLKFSNAEYILQVVNSKIFTSVPSVMSNISLVTEHLGSKGVPTLEYINTYNGLNYLKTLEGEYIRICKYVNNSISMEFSDDLEYIYNSGLGFGEFCYSLLDIPNDNIVDVIPNFHDTKWYLDRLFYITNALEYQDRVYKCQNLLDSLYSLKDYSNVVQSVRKRITHNDVKFSNVLFNRFDKSVKCVIDLDTIMNGYLSYDFADGVRSICRNLDNTLNLEKLEAYSKGFLSYPISVEEKSILIDSIIAISLELSSRYLYEYICNSNYFNLKSVQDNLTKASGYLLFAEDVISKRKYIEI